MSPAHMKEPFSRLGNITGNRVHVDSAVATDRRRFTFVVGQQGLDGFDIEPPPVRL